MQVDEDSRIALLEVDSLWEEHRRITVRIESEHPLMQELCCMEIACLSNKPLEERQSVSSKPFGMPLYPHDCFVLVTFHRFDDAIGRLRRSAETWPWLVDGLMMERVDKQFFRVVDLIQGRILFDGNSVGEFVTIGILTMLDGQL